MSDFERVWARIRAHQGQVFHQIRGGEFIYQVSGSTLFPDRTNQALPKSHFERAFALMPLRSTVPVQHLRGPSYLFAILTDARITDRPNG